MRGTALVWAVFRKELLDGSRDRRSITSLVFSAMIAPMLFGVMFTVAAERRKSADEIALPVEGVEYAPAFVAMADAAERRDDRAGSRRCRDGP